MAPSSFVCRNAMPGIGCNLPEMIVLSCIFILTGFGCIYLLYKHIKFQKNNSAKWLDLLTTFWTCMFVYMMYRGMITLIPFNYTEQSLLIVHGGLNAIIALVPISIFVLLVLELLFTYRNPGGNTKLFYRVIFAVFLFVFLIVGISFTFLDPAEFDPVNVLCLWHACTDIIVICFVAVPAAYLISVVSYPVIQPEDISCVRWSIVGIWAFCILFGLRALYNILHYLDVNPIDEWFEEELTRGSGPSGAARAFQFFFTLIFEYTAAVMAAVGAIVLHRHDLKFAEDPFYARASSTHALLSGK